MSNVLNSFGQFNLINTFRTVSSTSDLLASDSSKTIIADTAATTLTLPAIGALFEGWSVTIKNTSTGKVTISSASNIDGVTTFVLFPNYTVTITSKASTYYVSDVYQTQAQSFTVTCSGAITNNVTFELLRLRNFVIFTYPSSLSTTSGGSPAIITGANAVTSSWFPAGDFSIPVSVQSNGVDQVGIFQILTGGSIRWFANQGYGNFNASTALILRPFGFTYVLA